MGVFLNVILIVQIASAIFMIGLILVQHGKGADMGAAFGSGGSGSLFGASGSANFLSRTTSILAAVFFVSTLSLTFLGGNRTGSTGSVLEGAAVTAPAATPATSPAPTPANPANQIPGTATTSSTAPAASQVPAQIPAPATSTAPAAKSSTVPTTPSTTSTPANGAAQIPAK